MGDKQGVLQTGEVEAALAALRSGPPYAALADEFGVTLHAVKNALYETKRRIREEVGRRVNAYTCSPEDFQDEMEAFDLASLRKSPKKIDVESVDPP